MGNYIIHIKNVIPIAHHYSCNTIIVNNQPKTIVPNVI